LRRETIGLVEPTRPAVFVGATRINNACMRLVLERTPLGQLARRFSLLRFQEEGQTLVEYALILILVSVAAVTLLLALGAYPSSIFSSVNAYF
jgi:Flp pilus assembly pilin Flp